MKEKLNEIIECLQHEIFELSEFIYKNPELGYAEKKSSKAHIDVLKKHGFEIVEKAAGIDTAFYGYYDSNKPGASVGFLAEYDALPEIGHGCGHNVLGAVSTGSATALSKIIKEYDIGGKVYLFGTPAEETDGGKIPMVKAGLLSLVDIAMMAHPHNENKVSCHSLAFTAIEVEFTGKAAHSSASPEKGINALDAAILLCNGINALRQHVTPDVRIHGIINNGGSAPNIVPDKSSVRFYVRAGKRSVRDEVVEKFFKIMKGAELMTGAKAKWNYFENSFDDMNTNTVLSDVYNESFIECGGEYILYDKEFPASIDMGNVSYETPSIHPLFAITKDKSLVLHTKEFAEATQTEYCKQQMKVAMKALTLTGYKVISNNKLLEDIVKEFDMVNKG